jgi:hypothetical protein
MVAELTLRELGRPTLVELLDLTALIAQKNARRHPRVAARWLLRYLETHDQATIEQASFVASSLVALGGPTHNAAYTALRDMAETASRRATRQDLA